MDNRMVSALLALALSVTCSLLSGLDLKQFYLLFVAWYFYLRIGDRFDSLAIAVKSLQDALQRIEAKNDTIHAENETDQNENVRIAGNRHFTEHQQ